MNGITGYKKTCDFDDECLVDSSEGFDLYVLFHWTELKNANGIARTNIFFVRIFEGSNGMIMESIPMFF